MENIQNYRFLLALVLCLVIIPLGFYVNVKDYLERRQIYDETIRDYENTRKTVNDILKGGGMAFRPPSPLGLLSGGIELVLPNSVETRGVISDEGADVHFNDSRRVDNPFISLFGRLDLAFIVSTVVAVLIMIFSFNAISAEKEHRTLAQLMANSVSRSAVITAKLAAGTLLMCTSFLEGILVGVVMILLSGLNPLRWPDTWMMLAVGVCVSIIFLLVFYNLGLFISSLNRSSESAMVIMLASWVAMAMVIPKGSGIAAKLLIPVKSQQVIDLQKRQLRLQIDRELEARLQKLAQLTPDITGMTDDDYFKAREGKSPVIDAFEKSQAQQKNHYKARLNSELGKIDADFERQRNRQAALARNISRLSPISCFMRIIAELSGTGFMQEKAWRETRSRFAQLLDRDISNKMRIFTYHNIYYEGTDVDRNAPAPKLPPSPISLEKALASVWVDIILLCIYGIFFFTGAYVSFLRYDVR